jgi:protein involved in temperature-dependent protein secretion
MSYPAMFTTPGVRQFAEEIDAERQRQLAKFGEQHHPDGTGGSGALYVADRYRTVVDRALEAGNATWRDIALEEVYEALAESDPARLRAELVQVAAVCAAWIADLDSREAQR